MNKMELSKIEESLYILNKISSNLVCLIDFEKDIYDKLKDNPKVNQYAFEIQYIMILWIFHYLNELVIFKRLAKTFNDVKSFFNEIKEDLKILNIAKKDIDKLRNTSIGHCCRDKDDNFVHDLENIDKPITAYEIHFYAEYCLTISYAIGNNFNDSLNSALKQVDAYQKLAKKQRLVDMNKLDNILIELKIKYENKYKK